MEILNKEREELERTNKSVHFNLVWAHTAEDMHTQLEARPEWQHTLAKQNSVKLLKSLYALHHKQDDSSPSMLEVVDQDRRLYLCTQREHQSDVDFIKTFKNTIDAIEELQYGGT